VMMVSEFGMAQAREVGFRAIGRGPVDGIAGLMVDQPHGKAGVQQIPGRTFISMNHSAPCDPLPDVRTGSLISALLSRESVRPKLRTKAL
jgi:hypothetical protein